MSKWIKTANKLPESKKRKNGEDVGCLVWWKDKCDCGFQMSVSNREFVRYHPEQILYWMALPDEPSKQ